MKRAFALALGSPFAGVSLLAVSAIAAPPKARPYVAPRIAKPLPSLPTIPRVHLEVARDHTLVVEDVRIDRGDWTSGDLDLYVAFGAPALPIAFDAHIVSETDEAIAIERASRRTASSQPFLGRPQMSGAILHVKDALLRRAFARSDATTIRVRTLVAPPAVDAEGSREVVVRLGGTDGAPLALGAIDLTSLERGWVTRAEAHLCGPEADPYPLAIAVDPKPRASVYYAGIAPYLATRRSSDDLCVRFWTKDDAPSPTQKPSGDIVISPVGSSDDVMK